VARLAVYRALGILCFPGSLAAEELNRYEFIQAHMGVPFRMVLYSDSQMAANLASEAAFARVAELDLALSDYNPESELRRLCRTAGSGSAVPVSDELFDVLDRSIEMSRRTDGAFDVTVGPLVRLWRRARRQKEMPTPERLAEARERVGFRFVKLDEEAQTVELTTPAMLLDLGGIAKGYAVDEALRVLAEQGHDVAMVDASGDLAVGKAPPESNGWRIGLASLKAPDAAPDRFLVLTERAVATSGDAFQFVEIDGVRYSHIVDPHTGLGLTVHSSVTVVSRHCTDADALASAVSVLGPEAGIELIEDTPAAAALIVQQEQDELKQHQSAGWRKLRIEQASPDE